MPFTFLSVIHGGWKPAPNGSRQPQPDKSILLLDERVCGPDPEPNFRPAPRGMELAGHPPSKVAKRKCPRLDEPNPLSDERVQCADRTPCPTSIPSQGRWSRQVTHTGKSLRGQNAQPLMSVYPKTARIG
jgi:hypothetical protein